LRYVPTKDDNPKGDKVDDGRGNDWSDSMVTPLEVPNSLPVNNLMNVTTDIIGSDTYEENRDDSYKNQAPSPLEYSDGEGGEAKGMVMSDVEDDEEVDKLNLSEYEGLSMVGM
jgi:hypothetical protein